jgi:hypothetical protein
METGSWKLETGPTVNAARAENALPDQVSSF